MKTFFTLIILCSALVAGLPVFAADLEKGIDAYVKGDYKTAFAEFRPLAEQGDAKAQFNLGLMYYEGQGVLQDDKQAVKWYTLAAEQGLADAQFNLGFVYRFGKGVPQDDKQALKWYSLAAEQGDADAQFNLGFMYRFGKGVPQGDKQALKWYTLAAEQGDARAQFNLGGMYHYGPKDYSLAYMWYNIAASNGHENSAKDRDLVAEKMTHEQITQAQALSRACVAKNYKGC